MNKGKILVIRGGAIGDFILTLPVLSALRAQFPETTLEVLGYAHVAGLALAGGLADAVRSIEARAMAGFFARNGELDPALQEYFAGFAVILSYLYDPDEIFRTNIGRCSKAQFLPGPHRPQEAEGVHATEVLLRPLERLAIFGPDPMPRLQLKNADPAIAQPGGWLAVHPGSGSEQKNWPEQNWRELLQEILTRSPVQLLLVGGEAEGNRLERLARELPEGRYAMAQHLPLPELALRLSACAAFIGHDSGISHLAAALGVRVLVLWGPTSQSVWSPRGPHVKILSHPNGLTGISIGEVLESLPGR